MKRHLCILFAVLGLFALGASSAQGAFGLRDFDVTFNQEDGGLATAAGSHPYSMTTKFGLTYTGLGGTAFPDESLKDFEIELPVGFAGNPSATPTCARSNFLRLVEASYPACPDDTAVGVAETQIFNPESTEKRPVFNLKPPPGYAAELGFLAVTVPVTIDIRVAPGDPYDIVASATNISQAADFFGATIELWGDPENPVHDPLRGKCAVLGGTCPTDAQAKPFLTLPRRCAGPLKASFSAVAWQNPTAPPITGESESELQLTGCESLGFGPTIDASSTTSFAESPSGLNFDLDVDDPGLSEPSGTTDSDIKKAVVTLPEGMTTNSAVASGLGACTQAQYESETIGSEPGTGCPENSKIGSVEIETPLLEKTAEEGGGLKILHGSLYVAKQHDNEFDNLLTIDMVIKDPGLGILIRSAGKVEPDPVTGRITTVFDDLPQLPFSHFHLHFREGNRAPLITPPICGTFTTTADLYPYSRPESPLRDSATFTIGSGANGAGCAASLGQLPNAPGFSSGTVNPTAGSYSPFVLNLSRADGSQQISRIATALPAGLLGKLAGIPYCSDSQIGQAASRSGEGQGALEFSRPSCPQASEVGTVTVGAGAGSEPLYVSGHAYLAGPYKGAPLSLEIVTPAIAGPFDLGVVAVRTALQVDPLTAQITAQSDPIPTILHGLPLDVRSISLQMNRPSFTLNPTSCEPKAITGSATSTLGNTATLSQYFQASVCNQLKFKPKLALSLRGSTKHAGHPALKAVLTYPKGAAYSNVARAQVNLPHSEFIDQANLNKTCTKPVLLERKCPAKSVYGKVKAWTPLLDSPLIGNVYLVGGFGYKLPALVAELNGQIRVLLVGKVDSGPNHGIRNTFEAVPDAPVEKFVLELKGGPKYSLLENSENLCAKPQRAIARFTAQDGSIEQAKPMISNSCANTKRKKGKGKKKSDKRNGRGGKDVSTESKHHRSHSDRSR